MTAEWFADREQDYADWCKDHPSGFVVNTERAIRSNYLVLHRARCHTINPAKSNRKGFTGPAYAKVCADTIDDLRVALRLHVSAADPFSKRCAKCDPADSLVETA